MREALDQMDFVLATFAMGIGGTLALVIWAWADMRRAELRRSRSRDETKAK